MKIGRQLTKLHDEAARLLTLYEEYKDSEDAVLRRRVHVDLDRFLMENREIAALLMVSGLKSELANIPAPPRLPWYKRLRIGDKHESNRTFNH